MFCSTGFSIFISWTVLLSVQSSLGSEIIGGKEVSPHSLPFMALLEVKKPICGGILIQKSWVLTAAHCGDIKQVTLGVHSISSKKEKKSRQVQKVSKRFPHPSYKKTFMDHDLMLLKLKKPVKETKEVKLLNIANTDPKPGSTCLVAGWGATDNTGKGRSDVLMSVNVTIIDRNKCNSSKHYNKRPVITDEMICAGTDNKDTCQGDSGGPLICNKVLVGVTSFGIDGCGSAKHPGVYTFISTDHLIWIKKTIKSYT